MLAISCSRSRVCFLTLPRPPGPTRTDTLFPYTTRVQSPHRSAVASGGAVIVQDHRLVAEIIGEQVGVDVLAARLQVPQHGLVHEGHVEADRKSTRLNSSH